jgi:ABC-type dipeptide/oligopeptide/nickel transport system ATPase component
MMSNPISNPHLRRKRKKPLIGEAQLERSVQTQCCLFAPRCLYADDRCRRERPDLEKVSRSADGEHLVACFEKFSEDFLCGEDCA